MGLIQALSPVTANYVNRMIEFICLSSLLKLLCVSRAQLLDLSSSRNQSISNMAFIMEFAENMILRMMEDPQERDKKFREHLYKLKDGCQKTKEMWNLPLRPYGFWTFERHNAQINWDAQISQVQGRRDPYDDLLEERNSK